MKTHCSLFIVFSIIITIANAQRRPLSEVVTNTQLGQINTVNDKNILKAVVRANPQLPPKLKDLTQSGSLFVSASYGDHKHALIGVLPGTDYVGYVEVFFNGGQPAAPALASSGQSGKLNLSRETNLVRNLTLRRGAPVTAKAIIDAFMDQNPGLPTGLRSALRARINQKKATLYVPQPNFDYEGSVTVFF